MRRWIEHELFGEPVTPQIVEALVDLVASLTLVPPPWPQILIVDVAAIASSDYPLLGAIRDAGWPGTVIAIGEASMPLKRSLGIDVVLARTLGSEVLRRTIRDVDNDRPTTRMRRIRR